MNRNKLKIKKSKRDDKIDELTIKLGYFNEFKWI